MALVFTYGLFFVYIAVRIATAIDYYYTKKNCRELEKEIEKYWILPHFNGQQLEIPSRPNNYDDLLNEREKLSNNWRKLYFFDIKVKRIVGIFIGVVSLLLVVINHKENSEKVNLVLIMLPPIVNLFNTYFERYEVTFPVKIQKFTD